MYHGEHVHCSTNISCMVCRWMCVEGNFGFRPNLLYVRVALKKHLGYNTDFAWSSDDRNDNYVEKKSMIGVPQILFVSAIASFLLAQARIVSHSNGLALVTCRKFSEMKSLCPPWSVNSDVCAENLSN